MSIIDRAKTHFESIGVQSIEVPEWKDEDGKPSVIYWNPINLFEKNKLLVRYFIHQESKSSYYGHTGIVQRAAIINSMEVSAKYNKNSKFAKISASTYGL